MTRTRTQKKRQWRETKLTWNEGEREEPEDEGRILLISPRSVGKFPVFFLYGAVFLEVLMYLELLVMKGR